MVLLEEVAGSLLPCSTIQQAAAKSSANAAVVSSIESGALCELDVGKVKCSAMVPFFFKIPKTDRLGQ